MKSYFVPIFDWADWFKFRQYNWVNLRLLHADVEWDRRLGDFSFELIIAGVGFRLEVNYDSETDFRLTLREISESVKDYNVILTQAEYDDLRLKAGLKE